MKKTILIVLLAVLCVSCIVTLVACNYDDILQSYILNENGATLDEDFSLPGSIADHKVSWTSSDESAVKITKNGDDYLAKVTMSEDGAKTVKLTVKMGSSTKEFSVTIPQFDAYYFAENYVLPQHLKTVVEPFQLAREYTIGDKTATISWSIDDKASKDYLTITESDGKTMCNVTPNSLKPTAYLNAKFTYNGVEAPATYRVTVFVTMSAEEEIDNWYRNSNVSKLLSGYIVEMAEKYTGEYSNTTFYMIDDTFKAGYYVYHGGISADEAAQLARGVHVTVKDTTNTNYSGLMETNSGGTVIVDEKYDSDEDVANGKDNFTQDKGLPLTIEPKDYVYDLDNDLFADSSDTAAYRYHQSTYVRLSNWKITEMGKTPQVDKTATLFTVERDGVEVSVAVSKNIRGQYEAKAGDARYEAICALQSQYKVGDYVNIVGILGAYYGPQIALVSPVDVTAGTEDKTVSPAVAVKAAIEQVEGALDDAQIAKTTNGWIIVKSDGVTLPRKVGNVTITYKPSWDSQAVVIEHGEDDSENAIIKVTPGIHERLNIRATYTNGTYSVSKYFAIESHNLSAEDVVAEEIKLVYYTLPEGIELYQNGELNLPTASSKYKDVTYKWEFDEAKNTAEKVDLSGITLTENKLSATKDAKPNQKIYLKVTISFDGQNQTKPEMAFNVNKGFEKTTEPAEGTYKLMMTLDDGKYYFATGSLSGGYYFATSTNMKEAAEFTITKVGDNQYTIQVDGMYLEIRARNDGKKGVSVYLEDEQTEGYTWQWIDSMQNFFMETTYNENNDKNNTTKDIYFLGTYRGSSGSVFTTMSGNYIKRIADKSADGSYTPNGAEGESQWVAYFGTI